jgi:hypothetical protein
MFGTHAVRRSGAARLAPQVATPLFAQAVAPEPMRVCERWAALFPGAPPLLLRSVSETVASFEAGTASLMCLFRPEPVPGDEVLDSVHTSWMWSGEVEGLREHRAHAVVTAAGTDDVVADAWNVTRLSVCLLELGAGVALLWGNSRQVHRPELALEFARDLRTAPVPLWVGVSMAAARCDGPYTAITHGLEALGHRELEVLEAHMDFLALRETLLELALHVLEQGPVLQHGRAIGPSADEQWSIEHVPGRLDPSRSVIRLGIP